MRNLELLKSRTDTWLAPADMLVLARRGGGEKVSRERPRCLLCFVYVDDGVVNVQDSLADARLFTQGGGAQRPF